jgi:predicted dehydrogenase
MNKLRIGVVSPSEIAFRRFMPAVFKNPRFSFVGIAAADVRDWAGTPTASEMDNDKIKALNFVERYGGKLYGSYDALISDSDVDCVYIPLPPALHFKWAEKALLQGKHVLLEKPFTISLHDTVRLLDIAREKNLAVHENYMFQYHSQIDWIRSKLPELGELRLIRMDFGFPLRGGADFRYSKALGGGALLDCGGYVLKLALLLLGETARITDANLGYKDGFEVDIFGCATLRNDNGLTAQISFGMDNAYRCSLDAWGSAGSMTTDRVFTAPDSLEPKVNIHKAEGSVEYKLLADNSFVNSIERFFKCIHDKKTRTENYSEIMRQSEIVEEFKELAK